MLLGIASAEPTSSAQTSPRVGFHVLAMAKTTGIQVGLPHGHLSSGEVERSLLRHQPGNRLLHHHVFDRCCACVSSTCLRLLLQAEIGQYIPSSAAITTTLTGLTGGAANYNVAVRSAAADGRLSLPFDTATPVRRARQCASNRSHVVCSSASVASTLLQDRAQSSVLMATSSCACRRQHRRLVQL